MDISVVGAGGVIGLLTGEQGYAAFKPLLDGSTGRPVPSRSDA